MQHMVGMGWVPAMADGGGSHHPVVIRGLDPRIHLPSKKALSKKMACRVKPGNDSCVPLLRKPVRPALLDRALEGGARVHARQPRAQIWIRPELVEHLGPVADKTHLDISAGQRVA